jgi:hypothetical protein
VNAVAHPDLTIAAFETGAIDPDSFDHESHIYMGWLYIREYGVIDGLAHFDKAIRRLVKHLGAEDKYHMTITWFFMLLIAERFETAEGWLQFKQRNADLITGSKPVLSRYYTQEHLFSNRARTRFLLPDNLA